MLPEGRRFLTAEQEERGEKEKKMSSRREPSEIQHLDLLNNWLVAGGSNGILSVKQKSSLIIHCVQAPKILKLVVFGDKIC